MGEKQDFEQRLKLLLNSEIEREIKGQTDFLKEREHCKWIDAIAKALAVKGLKGEINAIKYINEICKSETVSDKKPQEIKIKVVQ